MARYDIHIRLIDPSEQNVGANFQFQLISSGGQEIPLLVTGFQALMNRWLKIFMTPKGSNPLRPNEGTDFPYLMGSNIQGTNDLRAVVAEHIDDATAQVQAVDQNSFDLTPQERLQDAALVQFNVVSATSIEFWVELSNRANERMAVLIPYAVTQNG